MCLSSVLIQTSHLRVPRTLYSESRAVPSAPTEILDFFEFSFGFSFDKFVFFSFPKCLSFFYYSIYHVSLRPFNPLIVIMTIIMIFKK